MKSDEPINKKELKDAKLAKKLEKQANRAAAKEGKEPQKSEEVANKNKKEEKKEEVCNNVNPVVTTSVVNPIEITPVVTQPTKPKLSQENKTSIFEIKDALPLNQIKQHFFGLTSYDDNLKIKGFNNTNNACNTTHHSKGNNNDIHLKKQFDINSINNNYNLTVVELVKIFSDHDLPILNEKLFILLLRMSNNNLKKQREFCSGLINCFGLYMKKLESKTSLSEFVSTVKKNFEKLSTVIRKITLTTGSIENTLDYMSKLLSALFSQVSNRKIQETKEIKDLFYSKLSDYENERLIKPSSLIAKIGVTLIKNNDCILVYGLNSYLKEIFSDCVKKGLVFSLVYVKSNDDKKIEEDIRFMSQLNITITFTCIVSISNIINNVTKVFLRAKSMLSNGFLLSKTGSSLIAHVSNNFKKPVIVFSETYKFWDKIQIDSYHFPNVHFKNIEKDSIKRLSLYYDITSANLINMVVCELGLIPATSIKVILREYVDEEINLDN